MLKDSPNSITRQQCKRKGILLLEKIWRSRTEFISKKEDKYWVDKYYMFGSSYTGTSHSEIRQIFSGICKGIFLFSFEAFFSYF